MSGEVPEKLPNLEKRYPESELVSNDTPPKSVTNEAIKGDLVSLVKLRISSNLKKPPASIKSSAFTRLESEEGSIAASAPIAKSFGVKPLEELLESNPPLGKGISSFAAKSPVMSLLSRMSILNVKPQPMEVPEDIKKRLGGNKAVKEWRANFENALDESPGGQLLKIAQKHPKLFDRKVKNDWLCKPPLTGICAGLGIEYVLQQEMDGKDLPKMEPNPAARYFSRLQIPVMLAVCEAHGLLPSELTDREYFDEVYERLTEVYREKAGLEISLPEEEERGQSLDTLMEALDKHEGGHSALILEDPKGGVAANHTIYINKEKGIIADGAEGVVIQVSPEDSFEAVCALYVNEQYGASEFENFTLLTVAPIEDELKRPNKRERFAARTHIIAVSLAFKLKQTFSAPSNENRQTKPYRHLMAQHLDRVRK